MGKIASLGEVLDLEEKRSYDLVWITRRKEEVDEENVISSHLKFNETKGM